MKAIIFDIQRNSFVDGPGIRTTVFFKGCNLRCKWCHNPESQTAQKQMMFYRDQCNGCGKCAEVCHYHLEKCDFCGKCEMLCPNDARKICGKEYTAEAIFSEVAKDKAFYENSGGGVTFSGGECMLQLDSLYAILKLCKENGIHTAVDTAGNVPWNSFEKVMPYTDVFLYDVKCFSHQLHMDGTGVSNRLILENLQKLSDHFNGDIIIRIPVIGGFNDNDAEMESICDFLKTVKVKAVELLPYHSLGERKYDALNMPKATFYTPDEAQMSRYKVKFAKMAGADGTSRQ